MSQWKAKVKDQQESGQGRGTPEQKTKKRSVAAGNKGAGNKELHAALEVANSFFQAKRFDEALKAFEAILEKKPDAIAAYLGIGNVHAAQDRYDDAIEYYAGALHIKKDFPPALVMSGKVYARQGLLDKAVEKFKEALEINPGSGNASLGLTRVFAKMGRYDEAIKCLVDALARNPQLDEARLALAGIYQRKGDVGAALKEVVATVTNNPESWQANSYHAKLLYARGEFKQAINASKIAVNLKPDNASLHNQLGRAYVGIREFDLALAEFNKALKLDAGMITARMGIARMYIEQGNLAEAKKMLIEMSAGTHGLMLVHRLLAEILMHEGEYGGAVAEFRAAILHGERLAEKYPELLTIVPDPGDSRKTAEAFQKAFIKIEADVSVAIKDSLPAGAAE